MDGPKETTTKPPMVTEIKAEPVPTGPASSKQPGSPSSSPAPGPTSSTATVPGLETTHAEKLVQESNTESHAAPSKTSLLQQQIQTLASLQTRMARIRSVPAHLLIFHAQSPLISFGGLSGLGLGDDTDAAESDTINSILNADTGSEATMRAREMGSQARNAFRMLNDAKQELSRDVVQGALKASRESGAQDKLDIPPNGRRTRKKRRMVAADSPAPFPSFHVEATHVFPPPRPEDKKVQDLDDLISFIREYNGRLIQNNHSSRTSLAIWVPSRPRIGTPPNVSDPQIVRVTIRDVTTVFVKLRHRSGTGQLCIDSVVALGPREKKGPYSHSDFTVFQKLTQHVSRMIEKEPSVSLVQLVDLLASYEDLFISHCSICRRVLPLEGHVPPVARVLKIGSITVGERAIWEADHSSCLHA